MRKKIRGGISILVAAAMLLTGGGAGIAAGAEEAVQAEAAQEATAVEAEPVETGEAGTEAGIAPIAFPNDIDPDAQMDEIVEDGIRELSTVD